MSSVIGKKRKRKHTKNNKKLRKRLKYEKSKKFLVLLIFIEKKVDNYYSKGDYYGKSITTLMFKLAYSMNKSNNKFLWLWIVGMTE